MNTKVLVDAASAISIGSRDYQEDALIADFPLGAELGFAVIADGMGGHAAGDVASRIAVTEVFSELKLQSGPAEAFGARAPGILTGAVQAANACIGSHSAAHAETAGMGTTMLALALVRDRLFWCSVGDSPLYLYRDGALSQLNADHSLAPQIDLMVSLGQISAEEGKVHPERNCLTSVLCGDAIPRIDCPEEGLQLDGQEILIAASDGLQFLDEAGIGRVVHAYRDEPAAAIAQALLDALEKLADPDQDNVSLIVAKPQITETARAGRVSWSLPLFNGRRADRQQSEDVAARSAAPAAASGRPLLAMPFGRRRPQ